MKSLSTRCGRRACILFCLTAIFLYSQTVHGIEPLLRDAEPLVRGDEPLVRDAEPMLRDDEPFPVFPQIEANIEFWKAVYSRYSTTQAIVHDSTDLAIIYGVITLESTDSDASAAINKQRMDDAKTHYRRLLLHLADHPDTSNPEAKRIAALFGPNTPRRRLVTASRGVRCQIGQKERFREGLVRSGAYLEEIREIFAANDLPESLSLLPHVESSFDIQARSKSGAIGMWQFTHNTGRRFLTINRTKDERRDFIQSTHAAAKLLKENFEKLHDWPMALTAYNHGAAGMMRAKQRKKTYTSIFTSYSSRSFGFASRNFYSEFIAAKEIAANYQDYFGELILDKPTRNHYWKAPEYIAAADIVETMGISLESLRRLNPSLNDTVFTGKRKIPQNHIVCLPVRPGLRLPGLTASLSRTLFAKKRNRSDVYIVKKGDTAGKIARENGLALADLIASNNLDRRATIFIDQKLKLPTDNTPEKKGTTAEYRKMKTEPRNASTVHPESITATPAHGVGSFDTIVAENFPDIRIRHTATVDGDRIGTIEVLPDETLGHYAGWLGTDIATIKALNRMRRSTVLRLHQKIQVPLNETSANTFERRRTTYHRKIREAFFSAYHVEKTIPYHVKSGDNIWRLSNEVFDVPVWLLGKYNPNVDFTALKKAQKLLIPKVGKSL